MTRTILTAAAALSLATGAAFAQGQVTPAYQQPGNGDFASGYLFPNDGSPSGDDPAAHVVQQQPANGFGVSHVYLFPPSEGADSGSGAN